MRALIFNKLDLSLKEGLNLDLEVCKLLGAECYPVITEIVNDGNTVLDFRAEDVIKQLQLLNLNSLDVLKLDVAVGASVTDYIGKHYLSKAGVKTLTLTCGAPGKLTYEYLKHLSNGELFRSSDILFITSEEADYLSKVLNIPPGSPHDTTRTLSEVLNIKVVALLNHKVGPNNMLNLIYHEGNHLEFKSEVGVPKDIVATYTTLGLALKIGLRQAFNDALEFAKKSVEYGVRRGDNIIPDAYGTVFLESEKFKVIDELNQAINIIEENSHIVVDLIPELQMNLAYSLPKRFVRSLHDIAAVPGRIVRVGDRVKATSPPEFGASKHLARALMKVMEYDPNIRSAANIRFDESILEAVKRLGYKTSFYDRSLEPPEIKSVEGATIPWGVEEAIKKVGYVPDVIYHRGDYGKEAMITLFGENPKAVVNKLLSIGRALKESSRVRK